MADTKKIKMVGNNFPCGTLEEILRMMRVCREKGNIDCEKIMKDFMGKDFRRSDYRQLKKKFFGDDSK